MRLIATALAAEAANPRRSSSSAAVNDVGPLTPVERHQHANPDSTMEHGNDQGGMRVRDAQLLRSDQHMACDHRNPFRTTALKHLAGGRAGDREPMAVRDSGMPGTGGEHELIALAQHDEHALGIDQRAPTLNDELEHTFELRQVANRVSDGARRLERSNGPLQLRASFLAALMEAGVVDRDRGPPREDEGGLLVVWRELILTLLVGQI